MCKIIKIFMSVYALWPFIYFHMFVSAEPQVDKINVHSITSAQPRVDKINVHFVASCQPRVDKSNFNKSVC